MLFFAVWCCSGAGRPAIVDQHLRQRNVVPRNDDEVVGDSRLELVLALQAHRLVHREQLRDSALAVDLRHLCYTEREKGALTSHHVPLAQNRAVGTASPIQSMGDCMPLGKYSKRIWYSYRIVSYRQSGRPVGVSHTDQCVCKVYCRRAHDNSHVYASQSCGLVQYERLGARRTRH